VCIQLMSTHLEVKYDVTGPAGVLAVVYDVSSEEVVAVGAGFCGVREKSFLAFCLALNDRFMTVSSLTHYCLQLPSSSPHRSCW